MTESRNVLGEAFERLELLQVAKALGFDLKVGVQSRPGREKERKPSFSVYPGKEGKLAWKDHSEGDGGGIWQFVEAFGGKADKKEMAEFLIGLAGLDASEGKLSRRMLREDLTKKRIEADRKYFEAPLQVQSLPKLVPMPACVRERYGAGWKGLQADGERKGHMAEERGWPVEWVEDLVGLGKVADPVLPWHVPGKSGAQRGFAFLVQVPVLNGKGEVTELRSIGYHQRFRTAEGRAWCFCPYIAKKEGLSEYQAAMNAAGAVCAPVPFFLGNPEASLWVVLEGQWDAACFWYVWNAMADASEVFVVGIRGAQGTGAFLAAWGKVLQRVKPWVWCISDNDDAGRRWSEAGEVKPGQRAAWTFVEMLREWGGARVAHSRLRVANGKDFNDWFNGVGSVADAAARVRLNFQSAFPKVIS
jgi:hypothetical protein